jgi:nicotinate phosphoribosyltransferase
VRLRDFQRAALEDWVQEYRGDLGIALTDVVGMDAFLADFDLYFAKLFDGLRHDSGDPVAWGEKALAHYAKLRIDAHTKRLVFSDGLDLPKALALYRHFADRTQMGFGIGTNLTNDVGLKPLNIVMKLVEATASRWPSCRIRPARRCATDETFLAYLRQVFFILNIIPNTVIDAFAKGEILQVLLFSVLFGFALHRFGGRGISTIVRIDPATVSQTRDP